MNLIPSLDLMNGKVVRLKKGDFEQVTIYDEDPVRCVSTLMKAGATCVHIVDLDGTRRFENDEKLNFSEKQDVNTKVILDLISKYGNALTLQLGGGIRSYDSARQWLTHGIQRVVVGTLFFSDEVGYAKLVETYPNRVVLALDVKDDVVCHTGWQVGTGINIDDVVKSGKVGAVHSLLVTDISLDSMLTGPNLELLGRLKAYPLMASGGIASEADCMAIKSLGIQQAIIGKAYYEGRVTKLGVM